MTWDAIGAIGQVLGSIAVFVTLGYLAVQIRQSRIAQNAATYESVNQGFNAINALMSTDASLVEIMLRGNADPNSLTPVDRYRYWATQQQYVNQYSQMFLLYKAGALSKDLWETHLDALAGGPISQHRVGFNAPDDFWQALDAYGPARHSTGQYHRASFTPGLSTHIGTRETAP